MMQFSQAQLVVFSTHLIGRKSRSEALFLSSEEMHVDEALKGLLQDYFLSSFQVPEFYHLVHESELALNEVYAFVRTIFEDSASLHAQSIKLAKHLYERSAHPKIKAGEFYVVYFKDCLLGDELVDAVGLFKSEHKDTFLKVYPSGDHFEMESQQGVNLKRLDKGALIFNVEAGSGYRVAVVDRTNKQAEAQYWVEDFLHIQPCQDSYHQTQQIITLAKEYVTQAMPQEFDVSRVDQVDLLQKSADFFREKSSFEMDEFVQEVIAEPEKINHFNRFKEEFVQNRDLALIESFEISEQAAKKAKQVFKSVIKLDKNFHIYVHGNRKLIERGEDEKGKYYKVYYSEES